MAKKRKPSAYNKFIKANWNKVTGTAPERMKKLGRNWTARKK